jgi:hypothetical protein
VKRLKANTKAVAGTAELWTLAQDGGSLQKNQQEEDEDE